MDAVEYRFSVNETEAVGDEAISIVSAVANSLATVIPFLAIKKDGIFEKACKSWWNYFLKGQNKNRENGNNFYNYKYKDEV